MAAACCGQPPQRSRDSSKTGSKSSETLIPSILIVCTVRTNARSAHSSNQLAEHHRCSSLVPNPTTGSGILSIPLNRGDRVETSNKRCQILLCLNDEMVVVR